MKMFSPTSSNPGLLIICSIFFKMFFKFLIYFCGFSAVFSFHADGAILTIMLWSRLWPSADWLSKLSISAELGQNQFLVKSNKNLRHLKFHLCGVRFIGMSRIIEFILNNYFRFFKMFNTSLFHQQSYLINTY